MGCVASKQGSPPAQGGQGKASPPSTSHVSSNASSNGTSTGPSSSPAQSGQVEQLDTTAAASLKLKDLTEKSDFHSLYSLGEVLGRGNYSVVRKATNRTTGDIFAVKIIKDSSLTTEDRDALKIETAILKNFDCPNIIKLYGFFEVQKEKTYYIVMEYISGGELFERIIAKECYTEEDAKTLVKTIGEAIKYCHERGVVHRDLKPENILLTSNEDDGSIKIADFGFAKQYDTSSDDALSTSCGTPGYVAPEILNGKQYGKEVDMWSFGVIIFILLSGYPPFHHENQKALFKQIKQAKYEFDAEYWGHISTEAKDLISNLLVVDGQKRLTIEQLLDHPWLSKTSTSSEELPGIKDKLQNIVNKRKLKAGINAVIAQNRMKKLLNAAQEFKAEESSDTEVDTDAEAELQQKAASNPPEVPVSETPTAAAATTTTPSDSIVEQ